MESASVGYSDVNIKKSKECKYNKLIDMVFIPFKQTTSKVNVLIELRSHAQ